MITGHYFDGKTSAAHDATLEFGTDAVTIHGLAQELVVPLGKIDISDRIANIARRIALPGGAVFETADNDAVDRARDAAGLRTKSAFVHWLESRWPISLAALGLVVVSAFAFVRWGIPAVAGWTARVLPTEVDRAIGSGTLELLDKYVFLASDVRIERQRELQARFEQMTAPLQDGHDYRLEFRDGRQIGANAFALPSGIILMTDDLVTDAHSDDEIIAVLAHEIGHVRGRHALRQMLEAAGISAMSVALFGDVSSISGVLNAVPVLLNARISREFETEADQFARQWMRENGVAESSFDAILCRIAGDAKGSGPYDFLATHPPLSERADCHAQPEASQDEN